MDWGAWWITVHRAEKSQTWLKQLGTHSLCKVTVIQKYFVSHTKKFIDFIPEIWIKQNIYTDKADNIPGYVFIALEGKLLRREMKNKSFLQKDSLFNIISVEQITNRKSSQCSLPRSVDVIFVSISFSEERKINMAMLSSCCIFYQF